LRRLTRTLPRGFHAQTPEGRLILAGFGMLWVFLGLFTGITDRIAFGLSGSLS